MAQKSGEKTSGEGGGEEVGEKSAVRKGVTEQEILELIRNSRDEGILQSELWKMVNADSREGSRAILRLEKKGLIVRRKELHQGRWTYRVISKLKFSSANSILDVPCAFCDLESKCGRAGILSPAQCKRLTEWLEKLVTAG
jgi:DNA-binding Lrp family transcriptional regulator